MPADSVTTIAALLKSAKVRIDQALDDQALDDQSAEIDARLLLQFCLQKPHSYLLTWPEKNLSETELEYFEGLLIRRLNGEPIAYIVGYREFWSMNLKVSADTLIPRPETELLVELAVERLSDKKLNVLDMGTGSGAIALAVASEKPNCQVLASDISKAALAVATENAQSLKISNVTFIQSDWGKNIPLDSLDMILSNPPYIEKGDPHLQQGDLRFEPDIALSASGDGLSDLQLVIKFAQKRLESGGWLLMEHGYNQSQGVKKLLLEAGFEEVQSWQDVFGNFRVSGGIAS